MKVAIIGAGIAGLTAARELAKQGLSVTVYEKSRGLGGRLSTKRLDWANIDIGAQYFTARDHRFKHQLSIWERGGTAALWPFSPSTLGASGLKPTADSTLRYVGTPNMNSLTHGLGRDLDIRFNTRIHSLVPSDKGWELLDINGERVNSECADWVVSALPAEQSRCLLIGTRLSKDIPDMMHLPCWALALATRGDVAANIQGIFGDDVISWVSRLSARPQRQTATDYDDLWMLHFSSDWSTSHGKDTPLDLVGIGTEWLIAALRKDTRSSITVAHHYKHYWRYARLADGCTRTQTLVDHKAGIAAIGDWLAGGRVEGAYLSALDFIDVFKKGC